MPHNHQLCLPKQTKFIIKFQIEFLASFNEPNYLVEQYKFLFQLPIHQNLAINGHSQLFTEANSGTQSCLIHRILTLGKINIQQMPWMTVIWNISILLEFKYDWLLHWDSPTVTIFSQQQFTQRLTFIVIFATSMVSGKSALTT